MRVEDLELWRTSVRRRPAGEHRAPVEAQLAVRTAVVGTVDVVEVALDRGPVAVLTRHQLAEVIEDLRAAGRAVVARETAGRIQREHAPRGWRTSVRDVVDDARDES